MQESNSSYVKETKGAFGFLWFTISANFTWKHRDKNAGNLIIYYGLFSSILNLNRNFENLFSYHQVSLWRLVCVAEFGGSSWSIAKLRRHFRQRTPLYACDTCVRIFSEYHYILLLNMTFHFKHTWELQQLLQKKKKFPKT